MNILTLVLDSRIPNFAMAKVRKFHEDKGDEVRDLPLYSVWADKIYVSVVFDWNKHLADEWEGRAVIGGSGWDLKVQLPPEIESVQPHMNWGFTTRGCIRNCPFCVVPRKEGQISIVDDVLGIWDGKSKDITLMDNNILASPQEHQDRIFAQLRDNGLRVDFNQGLDHRLITKENAQQLKLVRHKEYHFAFDHPCMQGSVDTAIDHLHHAGINRSIWYVLVGYNTTIEQDWRA